MQETNPSWLVRHAPKNLQAQIHSAVLQGFTVVSQTKTTAQLIRKKQFSCLFATLWFLLFGFGFLIYLFYYLSKKDEMIYLDIHTQPSKQEVEKEAVPPVEVPGNPKANLITLAILIGTMALIGFIISLIPTQPEATAPTAEVTENL